MSETGYIANFYLKLLNFCWFMLWWFACNIPDFDVSVYSTTNTFNAGVGKYYVVKKHMVFPTLALVNKPIKWF